MPSTDIASFSLREETGYDHDGYPMISGVPLQQGRVHDVETLELRGTRGAIPDVSVEATARWADGSVKWALISAPRFSIDAGARQTLTLAERGTKRGSGKSKSKGVQIARGADGVRVDTGRLRFTVSNEGVLVKSFESRVKQRWHQRAVDLDHAACLARGDERKWYLASASNRQIELESQSPQRVVIAVRGTHAAEDGSTFGPYILRFECLADSPQLRLTHSLVFDGDPQHEKVCASEITLRAVVGDQQGFVFGADDGRQNHFVRQQASFSANFRYAELFQDSVSHWRLERWVDLDARAVFCDEGTHSDGWMELNGDGGRMAVAVRECWQNHPKSLFVDSETGLMRIGLYARRAEPLNMRRYSDLVYNHTYEAPSFKKFKEGLPEPWLPLPRKPEYNAYGVRKTHNVALMFDEPNPSRATLFYNKPFRLTWTRGYTKKTGVVVPASSKPLSREARERTDAMLDLLGREMLRSGGTGYVDYFDLPHGFDTETQRWQHDYGGLGYLNNECMPNLGLWHAWLMTGRRDALDMGAAMARHNNDIDSIYLGKFAGKGCRHNVTHWADQDREPRISQPLSTRFYYYISGDRSYMDIVPPMLDLWNRDYQTPAKMTAYGYMPSMVASMLVAEESGMADCEATLRQFADAIVEGVDERGVLVGTFVYDGKSQRLEPVKDSNPEFNLMYSMFGATHTFAELAERYDHQPLRDALVRWARYQTLPRTERAKIEVDKSYKNLVSIQQESINTFRSLDLYGYAYEQTGDEHFRRALRHLKGQLMMRMEEHDEMRYGKPDAATRIVPVGHVYHDVPEARMKVHRLLFPLFDMDARMQHKIIGLWLHKLQGAAILGVLDEPKGRLAKSRKK